MNSLPEVKKIYNYLMDSEYINQFIFDKYSISNIFTKISNIIFKLETEDIIDVKFFDENDFYIFNNLEKILKDLHNEFMEYIVEKKVFAYMDKNNINHNNIKKISVSLEKKCQCKLNCNVNKCEEKYKTKLKLIFDSLYELIQIGNYDYIKSLVIDNPDIVNYIPKTYVSLLEHACDFNFNNIKDMDKIEIFELAKKRLYIIRLLLSKGATVNNNVILTSLDRENEPIYIKSIKEEIIFTLSIYSKDHNSIF